MAQRISVDISRRGDNEPDGSFNCPACGQRLNPGELAENLKVCPHCERHLSLTAGERIGLLADEGSWSELSASLRSADPLEFFDLRPYFERIEEAEYDTGLTEAMLAGTARMHKMEVVLVVMDFRFMGGSMGSVVGERFWRAVEHAIETRFPLVAVCASGGARMQEGMLSLLQMAKTACATELLSEVPVPFVSVLTHPTTGGVMASFATLADVIMAEPGALLCFSGPRVIEQTVKEKLPEGFGRAESNLEHGQVDMIVPRHELKDRLVQVLGMLEGGVACALQPLWEEEAGPPGGGGALAKAFGRIKSFANPSRRPPQG